MYQQRQDTDSASLDGMEEVFDEKLASLPAALSVEATAETGDQTSKLVDELGLPSGKRVLRGAYHQGQLLLREETLRPIVLASENGWRQSFPKIPELCSEKPPFAASALGTAAQQADLVSNDSDLVAVLKKHAEQVRVANELLRQLTVQLQEQKEQIERLQPSKTASNSFWRRFFPFFASK